SRFVVRGGRAGGAADADRQLGHARGGGAGRQRRRAAARRNRHPRDRRRRGTTVQEPVSLRTSPYSGDVYRTYGDALATRPRRGPGLHIALFGATFLSAAAASAFTQGVNVFAEPSRLVVGFPYAIAVMTILLSHEFGHYFLARAHRVD